MRSRNANRNKSDKTVQNKQARKSSPHNQPKCWEQSSHQCLCLCFRPPPPLCVGWWVGGLRGGGRGLYPPPHILTPLPSNTTPLLAYLPEAKIRGPLFFGGWGFPPPCPRPLPPPPGKARGGDGARHGAPPLFLDFFYLNVFFLFVGGGGGGGHPPLAPIAPDFYNY